MAGRGLRAEPCTLQEEDVLPDWPGAQRELAVGHRGESLHLSAAVQVSRGQGGFVPQGNGRLQHAGSRPPLGSLHPAGMARRHHTSTKRRTTYGSAPNTERALSRQEAHKATAPARGQPLGCLRAAGVHWQPMGNLGKAAANGRPHGAWAQVVCKLPTGNQGGPANGRPATGRVQPKRHGGAARLRGTRTRGEGGQVQPKRHGGAARLRGTGTSGEGEQVQPKRHGGAARLRGTRTRGEGGKSSQSATEEQRGSGAQGQGGKRDKSSRSATKEQRGSGARGQKGRSSRSATKEQQGSGAQGQGGEAGVQPRRQEGAARRRGKDKRE